MIPTPSSADNHGRACRRSLPGKHVYRLIVALVMLGFVQLSLALPRATRSSPSPTIAIRDVPTMSTMLPEGPHQPIGLPEGPFETVITAVAPELLPQDTSTTSATAAAFTPNGGFGPGAGRPGPPVGLNQLLHASLHVSLGLSHSYQPAPSPSPTFDINRFLIPTPAPPSPPAESDAFKRGCEPVYWKDGSDAGNCKWGKYWKLTLSSAMAAPDGFTREVLLFNDQSPGPTIHGYEGEEICVSISIKASYVF